MAKLKGVIFGVENVLAKQGALAPHADTLNETGKLVRFLGSRGVESIVMTNQSWTVTSKGNSKTTPLEEYVEKAWGGKLRWFQCAKDGVPAKQTAESIAYVRQQMGWSANETLFVGNTDVDMQASVNGKLLLLNAGWYKKSMDYGFGFESPKEVARFIDTFCFRDHFWYFKIEKPPLRVYSLAPLGSFYKEFKYYSEDFIQNVKNGYGEDEDFWTKFLCTSMYFSGLYDGVNYITAYPKHTSGEQQQILVKPMDTFAKCFRKSYLPDLIQRHTTAIKSQFNRGTVTHSNQLETICLNARPHRVVGNALKRYTSFPVKRGKTVLVIDDVCTKGMSFETARSYLEKVGANVICVSFLKALKHDYESLDEVRLPTGAFSPNAGCQVKGVTRYSLDKYVVDREAPTELTERLKQYQAWDWPEELED